MSETINPLYAAMMMADTDEDLLYVREQILRSGYSGFHQVLEQLKRLLKTFDNDDVDRMHAIVHKARTIVPSPGNISPSWEHIWSELDAIIRHKIRILEQIPSSDRSGEWQVILDNPQTNQEVVCYPGLSFLDAAYLYGYFRIDLKRNEYIRLQKVCHAVVEFGDDTLKLPSSSVNP